MVLSRPLPNYTKPRSEKVLIQGQKASRDQGHATLDPMLTNVFAQQVYNQGDDMFAPTTRRS